MKPSAIAVYPFLLAATPVLALFQSNALEVPGLDVLRPLLVAGLLTCLALGLSALLVKRGHGVALLGTYALATLYLYPLVLAGFHALWPGQPRPLYVLPLWALCVGVPGGALLLWLRRAGPQLARLTSGLNYFSAPLCLVLLGSCLWQTWRAHETAQRDALRAIADPAPAGPADAWVQQALATRTAAQPPTAQKKPDIYYIILDGYPRGDILRTRFHFDNQPFLDWLREQGFFVADKSHSNYAWTHLSLAATFNADYLQALLPAGYGADAPAAYRQRYQYFTAHLGETLIRHGRVCQLLQQLGYTTLTRESGYAVTRAGRLTLAQALLGPVTQFEWAALRQTALGPVVEQIVTHSPGPATNGAAGAAGPLLNNNVRLLQELPLLALAPGPKFIFTHVMAPHPPFCFDEQGAVISAHPIFDASPWLADNQRLPGYRAFLQAQYPRCVAGLNRHVQAMLKELLRVTRGQAVIIVQSDHGSQMGTDPLDAAGTDVPERFGILNALYLPPGVERGGLEARQSSVNTFRVVFNHALGCHLPLLEERAWFSIGDLTFTEVTERLQVPIQPP